MTIDTALDAISNGNRRLAPVVATTSTSDSCIAELVVNIAKLRASDSAKRPRIEKAVLEAFSGVFSEARNAFAELFDLDGVGETDTAFGSYSEAFARQIAESVSNQFQALVDTQVSMFDQFWRHLQSMVPDDRRMAVIESAAVKLFTDAESAGYKLGGVLMYGVHHAVPAIDAELEILRTMKRLARVVQEEASRLPSIIIPQLPSLSAANRMCDAEEHLAVVAADLRANSVWNRTEFAAAGEDICRAKDEIFSGRMGADIVARLGVDVVPAGAALLNYLPNAPFQLRLLELNALNLMLQRQHYSVLAFYTNLSTIEAFLESISSVHAGTLLGLLVDIIRGNISALRADLEEGSSGYRSALGNGLRVSLVAGTSSFLTTQVAAYAVLSALCYLFDRINTFATGIQEFLNISSAAMRPVYAFIRQLDMSSCGEDGAVEVENALIRVGIAAQNRMNGAGIGRGDVSQRVQELVVAIDNHEAFLICTRTRMTTGNVQLDSVLRSAAGFASFFSGLKQASSDLAKQFDLAGMATVETIPDAILRALQCLALGCNNPIIASTALAAQRELQSSTDLARAMSINMGTFDAVPRASTSADANYRTAAFTRLLDKLTSLAKLDLETLCNVGTEEP